MADGVFLISSSNYLVFVEVFEFTATARLATERDSGGGHMTRDRRDALSGDELTSARLG